MTDALVCYCSCPDSDLAHRLAALLVDEGLAACVNVLPGVSSVYRWQGAVETAAEVLLLIKTDAKHYPALESRLCAEHPYELPELIAVPVATGSSAYLAWLHASLT